MRIRLNPPISKEMIIDATGAIDYTPTGVNEFCFVNTNSKEIVKGDLFIALVGDRYTGESFVLEALANGAYALCSSKHAGSLYVQNTGLALIELSRLQKTRLSSLKYTVAITGSVGKTTTLRLATALCSSLRVHSTDGNMNNHIGVPLTLLSAPEETEALIVECGMNHNGELSVLSSLLSPDISVITSIGSAHIGNLGSKEAIAEAKKEIISDMRVGGVALIPYGEKLLEDINGATVSVDDINADYCLDVLLSDRDSTVFDYIYPGGQIEGLSTRLVGRQVMHCLSFAIAIALLLGISEEEIKLKVSQLKPELLRHRLIRLGDYSLLDDSYNASLESVIAALEYTSTYHSPFSALLGDILECGEMSKEIHRQVGEYAYRYGAVRLYLFGEYAPYMREGALRAGMDADKVFTNCDRASPWLTAWQIEREHKKGETVLCKASHKTNLERIIKQLQDGFFGDRCP